MAEHRNRRAALQGRKSLICTAKQQREVRRSSLGSFHTREVAGSKPAAPMSCIVRMTANTRENRAFQSHFRAGAGRFAHFCDANVTQASVGCDAPGRRTGGTWR
jgi:hypothetical protein